MSARMVCHQINLQRGFGGGEAYAAFFSRALAACGVDTVLHVHPEAHFWGERLPTGVAFEVTNDGRNVVEQLAGRPPVWVVCHSPLDTGVVAALREQGHHLCCFAHMPIYDRDPTPFVGYEAVFAVSKHVLDSLRARGINQVYEEPLLGIADFASTSRGSVLRQTSPYYWDRRKWRDRLLGAIEPLVKPFTPRPEYRRADGIVLGLASRLTPIKQFPQMFALLAPILARHPRFHLEVFGAGGYASVRDLKRALKPIHERVRFWGHQHDMAAVYGGIDYLLTGLPEKEALGLNVIEAQARSVPVLAVGAPPFTETVAAGVTGLFYSDPRQDGGSDFERLLCDLERVPFRIGVDAQPHLARFSEPAFVDRVGRLVSWCRERGMLPCA